MAAKLAARALQESCMMLVSRSIAIRSPAALVLLCAITVWYSRRSAVDKGEGYFTFVGLGCAPPMLESHRSAIIAFLHLVMTTVRQIAGTTQPCGQVTITPPAYHVQRARPSALPAIRAKVSRLQSLIQWGTAPPQAAPFETTASSLHCPWTLVAHLRGA